MGQPPIIIVGGGVVGLSLACELARRGEPVTLLERNTIGSGASAAAFAYLEPRTGAGGLREIEWACLERWPDYAAAVETATGVGVDYRADGLMHVAFEETLPRLRRDFEARASAGTSATWLTAREARRLEPRLSPRVAAGFVLDQVHWLDGRKFCAALGAVIRRSGASVRENTTVSSITLRKGRLRVATERGELAAARVALCCAMGRNAISGLPQDVPFCRPARGVTVTLAADPAQPPMRRMIKHAGNVLCPRSDGRLLVGPTHERGQTSLAVPDGVRDDLVKTARRVAPTLANLETIEVSSGIRALVGDGVPRLGQSSEMRGLYFSLGHGGSGYLRAPVFADELAQYMLDEAAPCPLASPYLARPA